MNILKLKSVTLLLISLFTLIISSNTSNAQLKTNNGKVYFKNNQQRLQGNGIGDFGYYSNHDISSYLSFYNNNNDLLGRVLGSHKTGGDSYFGLTDADGNWSYLTALDKYIVFKINDETKMAIYNNGAVKIGDVKTTSNKYKLFVEKGILTEKVRVSVKDSGDWADYVFEEDYDLMPLNELQNYISQNKHLPNVPSADEVVQKGIDMAQMDATLLEKIEELTLYVIQQQKEIEGLKTQINDKQ